MAGPIIAKELQQTLRRAFDDAAEKRFEYVTIEHLLLALLEDKKARRALVACGGDLDRIRERLEEFIDETCERIPDGQPFEPQQTLAVERVLQRAAIHAISSEMKTIDGGNVLVQIFKEKESHAVWLLSEEGVQSLDLKQYVSHGVGADGSDAIVPGADDDEDVDEEGERRKDPLEAFCTNLNAEAEAGRIDPLIGRALELERTIQILCRRRKNNPVYVGEPGVGKTAIAEGLALHVVEKKVPEVLQGATLFALDMGALLAGTKFRGQFEERLKARDEAASRRSRSAVLYIDEIHTIVGAGATTGSSSMDAEQYPQAGPRERGKLKLHRVDDLSRTTSTSIGTGPSPDASRRSTSSSRASRTPSRS